MENMKIYVKQLYDDRGNKIPVVLPEKGSEVAAGYDIIATSDPKIQGVHRNGLDDSSWASIDYIEYETNLFIAPSAVTFHTLIHPRSSVSKYNLVLANSIGLVDNDYRGMVICRFKYIFQPTDLIFRADTSGALANCIGIKVNMDKIYKKGDKIAQLVVEPTVTADWELVDDLTQTQRGAGGFGSTDKIGKPLVEVFSEEKKKFEERQKGPTSVSPDILQTYLKAGGIAMQEPYSEKMKKARRE